MKIELTINKCVSMWLKHARLKSGQTMRQAACLAGLSVERITCFERGAPVPLCILAELILQYGVDPTEFVLFMIEAQRICKKPPPAPTPDGPQPG